MCLKLRRKKFIFLIILIIIILISIFYFKSNHAQIIIENARSAHSIDDSWEEVYTENELLFAVMFYNTAKTEYCLSIYKKNTFPKFHQYIYGGNFGNIQNEIKSINIGGFTISFSLNGILKYSNKNPYGFYCNTNQKIDFTKPFVIITQ